MTTAPDQPDDGNVGPPRCDICGEALPHSNGCLPEYLQGVPGADPPRYLPGGTVGHPATQVTATGLRWLRWIDRPTTGHRPERFAVEVLELLNEGEARWAVQYLLARHATGGDWPVDEQGRGEWASLVTRPPRLERWAGAVRNAFTRTVR